MRARLAADELAFVERVFDRVSRSKRMTPPPMRVRVVTADIKMQQLLSAPEQGRGRTRRDQ